MLGGVDGFKTGVIRVVCCKTEAGIYKASLQRGLEALRCLVNAAFPTRGLSGFFNNTNFENKSCL